MIKIQVEPFLKFYYPYLQPYPTMRRVLIEQKYANIT